MNEFFPSTAFPLDFYFLLRLNTVTLPAPSSFLSCSLVTPHSPAAPPSLQALTMPILTSRKASRALSLVCSSSCFTWPREQHFLKQQFTQPSMVLHWLATNVQVLSNLVPSHLQPPRRTLSLAYCLSLSRLYHCVLPQSHPQNWKPSFKC